ncbi:MAG: hypothetical protein ACYC2G_10840 [Gemmatimonadaceae bacterium]
MNEDRLRQLYGRGIVARDARSELAGACAVEPGRLLALVRRELPEEERLVLLDQVMASSACREAFELLRVVEAAGRATGGALSSEVGTGAPTSVAIGALGDVARADAEARPPASHHVSEPQVSEPQVSEPQVSEPQVSEPQVSGAEDGATGLTLVSGRPAVPEAPAAPAVGVGRSQAPWWRRGGAVMALAACALLAVGLVTRDPEAGDGEATRGARDAVILLSPATDPVDGTSASTFAWRAVAGATRYEFELLDADGEPLHQSTTPDTVLTLPATVTLEPGVEYRWLVRAVTASGGQRSSPARSLRLPAR